MQNTCATRMCQWIAYKILNSFPSGSSNPRLTLSEKELCPQNYVVVIVWGMSEEGSYFAQDGAGNAWVVWYAVDLFWIVTRTFMPFKTPS